MQRTIIRSRRTVAALFLGALLPIGAAADMPLLIRATADAGVSTPAAQRARAAVATRPEVLRTGQVVLETAALPAAGAAPDAAAGTAARQVSAPAQRLALELFADTYIEIETTAIEQPRAETLAVRGRALADAEAPELATFSMTVGPESYLMSYQDLDTGHRYRVVGDVHSGTGTVTEIDPSLAPPRLPSAPLTPPLN